MSALKIHGLEPDQVWDYENGYYWFSEPRRLAKAMAHYELYKRIVGLPGDVMEFGVYKGASLIRLATFRAMMEAEHSRKIIGFDAFGKFPTSSNTPDGDKEFIEKFEQAGGDGLSLTQTEQILEAKGLRGNVSLVEGDIMKTLPGYFEKHPHTRIALLHVDVDIYEPSVFILEQCWDRLVPGGLVVFDDYNAVEGETKAVDEFLAKCKGLKLEKLPICHVPVFIVKA